MIFPSNIDDIQKILKFSYNNKIDTQFIGSGSNVLASDDGFNGIIISLKKAMKNLKFNKEYIYAESGAMLGTMVKTAISNGYKGFESLIGVPGTVGGALIMNAGAHGSEISELLISTRTINSKGEIISYNKKDIKFSYRKSSFSKDEIVIDSKFRVIKGNKDTIIKRKLNVSALRKSSQPLKYRSAGSIFRNPPGEMAAGYLIDKSGLKGLRIGDAEISHKHANFIINHGNANSNDIAGLINIIKNKVNEKFHINLELEIKLIGIKIWIRKFLVLV